MLSKIHKNVTYIFTTSKSKLFTQDSFTKIGASISNCQLKMCSVNISKDLPYPKSCPAAHQSGLQRSCLYWPRPRSDIKPKVPPTACFLPDY